MTRKHKPFGTYGGYALELPRIYGIYMDVQECQDSLSQGCRIRNKKAKRRLHNKRTRRTLDAELRKEVTSC